MPAAAGAPRGGLGAALAGPLVVAAAFAALAAWTWRGWPDPLVDFGRELYTPWRIVSGDALYRDVAYFNGPLSPHVNALLFRAFGASFTTLIWANLALLAGFTALLYRFGVSFCDRFTATVACLFFLASFAFAQLAVYGNFNWVAPYSHEATHGLLLGVGALACLARWGGRGRVGWTLGAGLLLGLAFLTKAEVFLAGAAAALAGLGAGLWTSREARGARLGVVAAFGLGFALPPLAAFGLLAAELGAADAWTATLGSWPWVVRGSASGLLFYRYGMGLTEPVDRLVEMSQWGAGALAAIGIPVGIAFLAGGGRARRPGGAGAGRGIALGVGFLVAAALVLGAGDASWLRAGRPLPAFALVGVLCSAALVRRARQAGSFRGAMELAWSVLALALLAKIALNARVVHYGFTLAVPASMLFVFAVVGWLPAWLDRRGADGRVVRMAGVALLAVLAYQHLTITARWHERKTAVVGAGADRFRADFRGDFVNEALALLERTADDTTLAVLPEGVMINWLARRRSSVPHQNYMPPELELFGEATILADFRAAPPDLVILAHKDTREYGYRFFGPDYGRDLAGWVMSNYRPVRTIGQEPLVNGTTFGMKVLERAR